MDQLETSTPRLLTSERKKLDSDTLPTNPNAPNIGGSSKVQIGAAAPVKRNVGWGNARTILSGKRCFRDIILQEVIGVNQDGGSSDDSGSARRGILKLRGESKDSDKQSLYFVNQAYLEDDDTGFTDDVISSSSPSTSVAATRRSAFPYAHRKSSDRGFAGIVELLVQRTSLDGDGRDQHPFGTHYSMDAMLEGCSAPKRQSLTSAFSKLVLWITLLCFLVGAAVGVIFLSETYNAKHRQDHLLRTAVNNSVTS